MPGVTILPNLADPDIVTTGSSFSLTLSSRFQQHITATAGGVVVTVPARRSHRLVNKGAQSFEVDIVGPANVTVDPSTTLIVSWDTNTQTHAFEVVGAGSGGSFVGLQDTPGSYTAQAGNMPVVNQAESQLIFQTPVTELADLSDVAAAVATPTDGDILVYRVATDEFVLEEKPAAGANPALNDLTDVTITAVVDREVLTYDQVTGNWINFPVPRAFLGLSDTPGTYSGNANQILAVNGAETGLEYIPPPTAGGDVSKVGTPQDNQIAVWTGDGTIEGTNDFTYDGATFNVSATGAVDFQLKGISILSGDSSIAIANIGSVDLTTRNSFEAIMRVNQLQGNLAITQFDSGNNATGSTYWRGDGTWASAGAYNGLGRWTFASANPTVPTPSTAEMTTDTVSPESTTEIRLHDINAESQNYQSVLAKLRVGDHIVAQLSGTPSNYAIYELTELPTNNGTDFSFANLLFTDGVTTNWSGSYVWAAEYTHDAETSPLGTVRRRSRNGTVTEYQPAGSTGKDNWNALAAAVAALQDGDELLGDPRATYVLDPTHGTRGRIEFSNLADITMRDFACTRDVADVYDRVFQIANCPRFYASNVTWDGQGGLTWPQDFPLTTGSITVTNPNEHIQSNTYVWQLTGSETVGCTFFGCHVKQHPGPVTQTASGFVIMSETFGFDVQKEPSNTSWLHCIFDHCGYGGIQQDDGGNAGTAPQPGGDNTGVGGGLIDHCKFIDCGWHAWTTTNGSPKFTNCQILSTYARADGPKNMFNVSGDFVKRFEVRDSSFVLRHQGVRQDWMKNLDDWNVSTAYPQYTPGIDGIVTGNGYVIGGSPLGSEIYRAVNPSTGGSIPTHTSGTVGNWEWCMNHISQYHVKIGNCPTSSLSGVTCEAGIIGGPIRDTRVSIRYEDENGPADITNSYFSGCISAKDSSAIVDFTIRDCVVNKDSKNNYAVKGNLGDVLASHNDMYFDKRCYHYSGTGAGALDRFKSLRVTNSKHIPLQNMNVDGDAHLVRYEFIQDIAEKVVFDSTNKFVDVSGGTTDEATLEHGFTAGTLSVFKSSVSFNTPSPDGNLIMSGTGTMKMIDTTLTGDVAHPAVTGRTLNASTAWGKSTIDVERKSWAGPLDTATWTFNANSQFWIEKDTRYPTRTTFASISQLSGLADGDPVIITDRDPSTWCFYDSNSGAEIDNGIVFAAPGPGTARLVRDVSGAITPEMYGAVGDGVANDTTLFQAALDGADKYNLPVEAKKTYLLGEVFLYNNISIDGKNQGTFITDSSLESADPVLGPHFQWFTCGTDQKRATPSTLLPWKGRFANATLNYTVLLEKAVTPMFFEGAVVENLTINTNGFNNNKPIGAGFNNNEYASGAPATKDGIHITANKIRCDDADRGECIGIASSKNFLIHGNICSNAFDDLGIHGCEEGIVSQNMLQTNEAARILVSDSRAVTVVNNQIDYTGTTLSGMGISLVAESTNFPAVNQDIIVSNNIITYHNTLTAPSASTYGIRVQGGRNISVTDNILRNFTSFKNAGQINVENTNLPGWIDPTGLDPNDFMLPRNVTVTGNQFRGETVTSRGWNYQGKHKISSNEPTLTDGTGTLNDAYQCREDGTRDFGNGDVTVSRGDYLVYNASNQWERQVRASAWIQIQPLTHPLPEPMLVASNYGFDLYYDDTNFNVKMHKNEWADIMYMRNNSPQGTVELEQMRCSTINNTLYTTAELRNGETEWAAPYRLRILRLEVEAALPVTAGFCQYNVFVNDINVRSGTMNFTGDPTYSKYDEIVLSVLPQDITQNMETGDTLRLELRSQNATPTYNDFIIRIVGLPMESDVWDETPPHTNTAEATRVIPASAAGQIGACPEKFIQVTGSGTIDGFGEGRDGDVKFIEFTGAATLQPGSGFNLPGTGNIITAPSDGAVFSYEGAGARWTCTSYLRDANNV